jgi:NADH:ubiquinone oxidoreductase subunit 3 (subunit A)
MVFLLTYFDNYIFILFYIVFSAIICFVLLTLSVLLRYLSAVKPEGELSSAYECGFLPFDRARNKFEVKFFVVAILFVLFDLEVMFILPWAVVLHLLTLPSFIIMVIFIVILFVTFMYEVASNAMDF